MNNKLAQLVGLAAITLLGAVAAGCSSGPVMSNNEKQQFNPRISQQQKDTIAQHRRQSEFGLGNPQANATSNQSSQ